MEGKTKTSTCRENRGLNPEAKKIIKLYFDGCCGPTNPGGIATWGIVVLQDEEIVHAEGGFVSEPFKAVFTNNIAEYTGLIKGLEFCISKGYKEVQIYGDSKLVIQQMKGEWEVRSPNIIPIYAKAQELAGDFEDIKFSWIPRIENSTADAQSKEVYEKCLGNHVDKVEMPFGKYRGMKLVEILKSNKSYLEWLSSQLKLQDELKCAIKLVLTKEIIES